MGPDPDDCDGMSAEDYFRGMDAANNRLRNERATVGAVHLHEIVTAAVTGMGTRPRPNPERPEECIAVPVLIGLWNPGDDPRLTEPYAIIPATDYTIYPKGESGPARLVLAAIVKSDPASQKQIDAHAERIAAQSALLSAASERKAAGRVSTSEHG